eukprot:jgi/Hompol1/2967/HPOL_006257-RA
MKMQTTFDPLDPLDPASFNHKFATVNGRRYHYVEHGTGHNYAVLCHGFPDSWFSWRFQIQPLVAVGFHVIVPDLLGYGQTDAPLVSSLSDKTLRLYGMRSVAGDIVALLDAVSGTAGTSAVMIGHDWGGDLVWRTALYYPERVRSLASLCTPFWAPRRNYMSLDDQIKRVPHFEYRRKLAAFGSERFFVDFPEDSVDRYFKTNKSDPAQMDPMARLMKRSLTDRERDAYIANCRNGGLTGSVNWYRTMRINFEDELEFADSWHDRMQHLRILVVSGKHDLVLTPAMAAKTTKQFANATIRTIDATHWLLFEAPDEVNAVLIEFLQPLLKIPAKL